MKYWVLLLLLCIPLVHGATVKGIVYDFSLEPTQAVVTINTTPTQTYVAKPEYSFEVPAGSYVLKAEYGDENASERITVPATGTYTLDLILFPILEDLNVSDVDVSDVGLDNATDNSSDKSTGITATYAKPKFFLGLFWLAIMALLIYAYHAKDEEEEENIDHDAQEVLNYIRQHKRTTQKEIRKQFHHSSAKISLILTELEDKDHIQKIKKGRGNVIIAK